MQRNQREWRPAMRVLPALLAMWGAPASAEPPPQLVIAHRLVAEFVGAEQAQGTIVLALTNRADEPLRGVMLRLADSSDGQVTGAVNEALELAPHETRTVDGHFHFDPAALAPGHAIEWHVLYRDADGYSLQARVVSTNGTASTLARAESPVPAAQHD